MAKYLMEASYTPEGAKGLIKEGGTKRVRAIEKAFQGIGGKIEAVYFGFGKFDVYIVADFPAHANVAAASLAVNATGLATVRTTVLLTPREIDAAARKSVPYRGPGR
jgi:uncharacterized protein with GYD domain